MYKNKFNFCGEYINFDKNFYTEPLFGKEIKECQVLNEIEEKIWVSYRIEGHRYIRPIKVNLSKIEDDIKYKIYALYNFQRNCIDGIKFHKISTKNDNTKKNNRKVSLTESNEIYEGKQLSLFDEINEDLLNNECEVNETNKFKKVSIYKPITRKLSNIKTTSLGYSENPVDTPVEPAKLVTKTFVTKHQGKTERRERNCTDYIKCKVMEEHIPKNLVFEEDDNRKHYRLGVVYNKDKDLFDMYIKIGSTIFLLDIYFKDINDLKEKYKDRIYRNRNFRLNVKPYYKSLLKNPEQLTCNNANKASICFAKLKKVMNKSKEDSKNF